MGEGESRSRLRVRPATSASCLYCREVFAAGEPIFACEACGVGYHRDCMRDELGRCATLGCEGQRAMPRRARAPVDFQLEQQLRAAFGGRPDCLVAPLDPAREEAVRRRLARGMTADEVPLLLIHGGGDDGIPQAVFTDKAAYMDFSGGQQGRRLPYAALTRVNHGHGRLRLGLGKDKERLVQLGPDAPQRALREFFDAQLDQPWRRGQGFACDRCLRDFESRKPLVECRGCGACQHVDCALQGPCPGPECAGAEQVRRLAPAFFLGVDTSPVGTGCPGCASSFGAGDPTLTCEGCRATYHVNCLHELGACATRGCAGRRAIPGRHPRSLLPWFVAAVLLALLAVAALSA